MKNCCLCAIGLNERWYEAKRCIYLTSFPALFASQYHLECLSVRGQYRPIRAPNPENAVGSRVRPRRLGSVLSSACESAENAGRLLGAYLAAHPFSPRTARQSQDCLRVRVRYGCTAIFAPSALFSGISRRCTGRYVRLRLRSPRYRRIRFNRECHPSWHLRRLASRRYASHRNPTASAQAVCHPLSGGSVACLVSACASLHAGDRALCAVIAFQCFTVQLIAV